MDKREQLQARIDELIRRRDALVDQLSAIDASSASVSSGGGSKSYSNRSVEEIKAKIRFIDKEIARLEFAVGIRRSPGAIEIIRPRVYA